jgi:glycerol-3-phosphate dehydrogenase (NAD(P)+)
MAEEKKIAVLGGGSFGTAIAQVLAGNGHSVRLWMRDADQAHRIRETGRNERYFPDQPLSRLIEPVIDIEVTLGLADTVFVALPSKAFRPFVAAAKDYFRDGQRVISTTKGIEKEGFRLMSEILLEELPHTHVGVLSGPNLAGEIMQKELTATVIASANPEVRKEAQRLLGCDYFRVYANVDTYGVELGGALKNIYAVISGLAAALDVGENTKAMIISRSLAEMSRFAVTLGANPMTFLGLAGVGDLFVTCTSSMSRNFRVGYAVGQGTPLEDAVAELGQVAEGIHTLQLVKDKAEELEIYMPLVRGLYEILYSRLTIQEVIKGLMTAAQNSDVEFVLPRQGLQQ